MTVSISPSARKFMEEKGIQDVTFHLKVMEPPGCCIGIVKEIEPAYEAVPDATGYRYFHVEGKHFYISREIKIIGALKVITEGIWRKRLALMGATVPL